MNFEVFVLENLDISEHLKGNFKSSHSLLLNGLVSLYQKTKKASYKEVLSNYFNDILMEDGSFSFEIEKSIDFCGLGESLYFMLGETKDEKYKRALVSLYHRCRTLPRNEEKVFVIKQGEKQINFNYIYDILPFYMNYETQFNKKENYNDIIAQFISIRNAYFNEDTNLYCSDQNHKGSLYESAMFLMTLVDTIEFTSEEIYEHYKKLIELFKETLAGILKYQDTDTTLICDTIDCKRPSLLSSLMTIYAMKKACSLGILLSEKYEDTLIQMEKSLEPMLERVSLEEVLGLIAKLAGVMKES